VSAWIRSAVESRLERPDYAAVVRTALGDAATRDRLAALPCTSPDGHDCGSRLAWVESRVAQARTASEWKAILAMIEEAR
jgi:hypothetical protein